MAVTNKYSSEELQRFGDIVMAQLGGRNKVCAMIGVKQLAVSESDENMQMIIRFKAKATNKSNCVRITLQSNDLYKMEFISIRGFNMNEKGTDEGLYSDMLKSNFEQATGLRLTL